MIERDRDIHVVVIGFGLAGSVFHAPLIASVDGLRVAAVVTRDPARRAEAETRYPGVRVLDDPGPVWDDPAGFDLVVVATPNRVHVDLASRALAAGLAVVVDKPVAATTADALMLKRAAETAGLPLGVFHNRRWDGDMLTVSQLIAGGHLGKVHRFESHFERWRPQVRIDAWRERSAPEEAGGLLYDLGTHLIDQALTLFGPVSQVYAELRTVRDGAQVDDDVFVALTHRAGPRLICGRRHAPLTPRPGCGSSGRLRRTSSTGSTGKRTPCAEGRRQPATAGEWSRLTNGVGSACRTQPSPFPLGPATTRSSTGRFATRFEAMQPCPSASTTRLRR
jgi:predicted dehydrogenase